MLLPYNEIETSDCRTESNKVKSLKSLNDKETEAILPGKHNTTIKEKEVKINVEMISKASGASLIRDTRILQ